MKRLFTLYTIIVLVLVTACTNETTITNNGVLGSATNPPTTETAVVTPTYTITQTPSLETTTSSLGGESGYPELVPTVNSATAYPVAPQPDLTKSNQTALTYSYHVVNTYPHDPAAFTQGLVFLDGFLYEGTGRRGQSSLRKVDLDSGEVLMNLPISDQYFGEGITIFDNKIYQLTWQSNIGFIYDKDSFDLISTFSYPTEGWGLTHDGDDQLIMSDGSNKLFFLDPQTLEVNQTMAVFDANNNPITRLNELEYIDGEIYANIWQTNKIVRINSESGEITAWIDLEGLLDPNTLTQPADVLNGIAYDARNCRLFVTGKLWPTLFEIELVETAVAYPSP